MDAHEELQEYGRNTSDNPPIEVFISYAPEDVGLLQQLEKHLSLLKRQGMISIWQNRQIVAGTDRVQAIETQLERATVILLLVSANFLASDYCYDKEMQRALERHQMNQACVIPIVLRPVDWHKAPFAHLQALPANGKAITMWANQEQAFTEVVADIYRAIEAITGSEASTSDRHSASADRLSSSTPSEPILTQPQAIELLEEKIQRFKELYIDILKLKNFKEFLRYLGNFRFTIEKLENRYQSLYQETIYFIQRLTADQKLNNYKEFEEMVYRETFEQLNKNNQKDLREMILAKWGIIVGNWLFPLLRRVEQVLAQTDACITTLEIYKQRYK